MTGGVNKGPATPAACQDINNRERLSRLSGWNTELSQEKRRGGRKLTYFIISSPITARSVTSTVRYKIPEQGIHIPIGECLVHRRWGLTRIETSGAPKTWNRVSMLLWTDAVFWMVMGVRECQGVASKSHMCEGR